MYYNFDDKTRFAVIYQDVTKTVASISKYTKISERTIRYWITQLERGEDIFEVKEGRGRKKSLSEDKLERMEEEVKADPYKASSRALASQYSASQPTILSALHELKFEYKPIKAIPGLTEEHKRLRLEFCQRIKQDPSQLYRIWFSDEMGYNLQLTRKKVWTQEERFYHEKPKNEKLNVWAAFSAIGKTSLEIYDETLKSPLYIRILEKHYLEMERVSWRRWAFQQDNLSVHTNPQVKAWFESKAINLLDWPPYSPDLSPIENLWGWLKEEVMKDNPKSLAKLHESLRRNWDKITVDFLQNYLHSLFTRIELCIE